MFQLIFTSVLPVFYQCFTSVLPVFCQCFASVSPVFHQCFTSVSPVFHLCFTCVSPVFHQSFTSYPLVLPCNCLTIPKMVRLRIHYMYIQKYSHTERFSKLHRLHVDTTWYCNVEMHWRFI